LRSSGIGAWLAHWDTIQLYKDTNMNIVSRSLLLCAGLVLSASAVLAAEFKVETGSQVSGRFPNAQYANTFGCQGGNVSPQVAWQGAPEGTRSFVVTMYDPDAPTGSGWWHWVVANLPATVSELPAGAGSESGKLPAGAVMVNSDPGHPGYFGLCPPVGRTHRYVITVHALKVEKLELPPNATPALVGYMAYVNGLGKASTTVLGGR
jgi:Raf kinase inhibitor-like YbhB/YbcL family protein